MDYNYYPPQSGHPPPPVTNQPHGGPQMQHQPPPGGQMMHAPMPPQNIRQAMPPGPPNHHQQQMQPIQQQHQQHISHHPQQMAPHQQPHPNYQMQPHPHGPALSHSGSPHPQQHHNHQPTVTGPPSQQSTQHHIHPQSPHHQGGQPGGPIPQSNIHHYPQQNHPHHQPQHHHQQHHHHQQPPMMHHGPPHMSNPHHISMQQQGIGRNSPHYPSILQTEFRIIELNRRLQCRPIARHPVTPIPTMHPHDEANWWEKFASEFFEDDATLTLRSIQDDKPVEYTIGRTLIPRFFRTYFEGGVTDLSINLRNPKEMSPHPHLITLDCDQAYIITNNIFKHPAIPSNHSVVVHTEGRLILDFVSNNYEQLSIKSWKFFTKSCREYIDRSITALGLSNTLLVEPITRQQGLTKSTISYLKMCMIMEPMQDLMFQHKQSKMDPRSCLRKLLYDKYKYRGVDDNRVVTNKRRKRKPSAAPPITGNPNAVTPVSVTNKKSKTSINNSMNNNNAMNNNINMMSPSGQPSFSLASQDVMVVGEPSMMGGDFGDDNERMITRLENTQYDPTASTPSNAEESDSINPPAVNDNGLTNNNIELSIENHTLSPSLQPRQHQQSLQQPQQQVPIMSQDRTDQTSPQEVEGLEQSQPQPQQRVQLNMQNQSILEENATPTAHIPNSIHTNQINLLEHNEDSGQLHQDQSSVEQQTQQTSSSEHNNDDHTSSEDIKVEQQPQLQPKSQELQQQQHQDNNEEVKLNSIIDSANDSNLMHGVNSNEHMDNHTNSIQPLNDESNSNSQLTCSTAPATSAIEQQPVDNGLA